MGRRSTITPSDLECMLCDETEEPKALPLLLLEEITGGFSDQQKIGSGGFAVVYKGKLKKKTVAVKRMSNTYMYEKEFHREVECLMMARHKNVVRFLGYCADTQGTMARYDGKFVMADVQQRLLCFEYLPKGSLDGYITDTTSGLQWRDRYQIIKGVCQGLHYLHQKNIVHLDLKPANILLDDNLVAKISDFGLSRCFDVMQSRVITVKIGGTLGYLAPEFSNGEITYQFDIYSLGVVIIEILTGKKGYHDVDSVVESWSNMLEKSQRNVQLEQVRVCAEIGIECTDFNPAKRPDTRFILDRIDETETMDGYTETGVITSQQVELASNELHQNSPNEPGEASSEENTTAGTNPYILFWKNIANLNMVNETMHRLNPDIRRCLEYCSIFPRGSKLMVTQLVHLWIAQGFVKTSCAIENMEDVAEGYIQELASCSLLQLEKNWYDADCFTICDQLYDLLDKVAGSDYIRIENGTSQTGEGWGGDVHQDVQHIFMQNYDAKLITEVLGFINLRTLIIYSVEGDTPVEVEVMDSIFKELPELRVLAFALSHEHYEIQQGNKFSVPESICQLKHLSYFAFRTHEGCTVTLPSTLHKLRHIQLLDFGDGDVSEFTFAELVNLQHIFCMPNVKLPYVGRLISLQTLPAFTVRNEQGCELKQLRGLNKLRGCLDIRGVQNVRDKEEALEANLTAKKRLTELDLRWDEDGDTRCTPEVQADVLEGLCPPMELQTLRIYHYQGSRYPEWMVGRQNGGPKELQQLWFWRCKQLGPAPQFVEAYPHLRVLKLWVCNWDALPGNIELLTSLKALEITGCRNIQSLPKLPQSIEKFCLSICDDEFMISCQTVGHPNWQKIEHIPNKYICGPSYPVATAEPVATSDLVATAHKQNKILSYINRLRCF